ncbi:MAG TPA: hypothetical protein VN841_31330 [Bryobacteraceae bacterium]|nr:hypothetical protein [Bryobacteraceae bacterium]
MAGQIRWAIYGGIAFAAGIILLVTSQAQGAEGPVHDKLDLG